MGELSDKWIIKIFLQETQSFFKCRLQLVPLLSLSDQNLKKLLDHKYTQIERVECQLTIKCFLITDDAGFPFYSRIFNGFEMIDPNLFSGLISAIGSIGKRLFNQEIATISYGMGAQSSYIAVVPRELFASKKLIYFVFFFSGEIDPKRLRELSTMIFMEAKQTFMTELPTDKKLVQFKIDNLIDTRFQGLKAW